MKIGQKSGRLDYYSISPIIRQILLYWEFDLRDEIVKLWQHTKKYFFIWEINLFIAKINKNKNIFIENSMQKRLDTERVCNKKYLKTKIKPYEGKINSDFVGSKVESSYCVLC